MNQFPQLDPDLFSYTIGSAQPKLTPLVQRQIQTAIGRVIRAIPVRWVVLTGSALRSSDPTSVLKVVMGIENIYQNFSHYNTYVAHIQAIDKDLNIDSFAQGTRHPIKYLLTTKNYNDFEFKDAYAFMDDKWLKSSYVDPIVEKVEVKRPTKDRMHIKKLFRGLNRKKSDFIPDIYKTKQTDVQFSGTPFETAKKSNKGIWKITRGQAIELAKHFHLSRLPLKTKPYKMLGNTGIMMYRPAKEKFFLVKGPLARKVKIKHVNVL